MSVRRYATAALAIMLPVSWASATQVIRGPYLQSTDSTSTVIRWRTDGQTFSAVRYGAAPGALDNEIIETVTTTEHEVEVVGLSPNTTYYYSVGSASATLAGDDTEHVFTTHPPRGEHRGEGLTFWVVGDQGTGSPIAERVRDKAMGVAGSLGWSIDACLALGDNAYGFSGGSDGTDAAYQNGMFTPYANVLNKAAIWPCVGNHDLAYPDGGDSHDAVFTLPQGGELGGFPSGTERYFSFNVGNVHVISLSWDNNFPPDDPMVLWLIADLAANELPWTIAYLHGPPHTNGSHNSDTESILITHRQVFTPWFATFGVDLVLAGHSHNYERSALVDTSFAGSSWDFVPAVHELDSGDGQWQGDGPYVKNHDNGVVYAVVGNSGKGGAPIANPHPVVKFTQGGNGSALVRVTCDTLEFLYIDQYNGITDSFNIVKPAACAPDSCMLGTVPSPAGGMPYPMLRVNGSAGDAQGRVATQAGLPIVLSAEYASGGFSLDVLEIYGHIGAADTDDATQVPGFGLMCFTPRPMDATNGKLFALGVLTSDPPPVPIPWSRSYTVPARMAGKTVELQGVIDVGGTRYVTNRVRLLILP